MHSTKGKKMKKTKPSKALAKAEAEALLEKAKITWAISPKQANKIVHKARQLAMKHRVHLDATLFCRKCEVPFVADTLKVRQDRSNQTVLYACRKCNYRRRVPYKRKQIFVNRTVNLVRNGAPKPR
jgi:RNase P subunit RPR2